MGKDKIILSPEHGVNPTVPVCYYCGKEKNQVALLGKMEGDVKAPSRMVIDAEPCDECAEHMKIGVMLIGVRNGETGENPYRTGDVLIVTLDAAERMFGTGKFGKNRACFVPDTIMQQLKSMHAEAMKELTEEQKKEKS
jgi:hypothetical protein